MHAAHLQPVRISQIRLQRVITDAQRPARFALVAPASLEDEPDVAAPPGPQRVVAHHRRQQHVAEVVADADGQIVHFDRGVPRQRERAFHHALELAHVAWPVVREQRIGSRARQRELTRVAVPLEKVRRELENVFAALPQRRHVDLDTRQPVIQIGAKHARLHQTAQLLVCGRHDTRVDPMQPVATDPFDRQVLKRPQQLRLRGERQVGDLVEKQGAAVRAFELPAAPAHAGRRPVLDAEELGLEQRLDDRRTIDWHERPAPASADFVNLPRDQLFAGAALAVDERDEIRCRHSLDAIAHGLHDRTRSD